MQAAQVRKVAYVPDETAEYHPDRHSSNTIYAGTTVAQAGHYAHCLAAPSERCFRIALSRLASVHHLKLYGLQERWRCKRLHASCS